LAVKDNQPTLHAEVRQAFETALETDDPRLRRHAREETGHGRHERRVVWVHPAGRHVAARAAWAGLGSLVRVVRVVTCQVSGIEAIELRHYISSLRPSARRLAEASRGHWGIENPRSDDRQSAGLYATGGFCYHLPRCSAGAGRMVRPAPWSRGGPMPFDEPSLAPPRPQPRSPRFPRQRSGPNSRPRGGSDSSACSPN